MNHEEKQALIERCKKISEWRGKFGDFANVMLPAVEAQQIAEIALAALMAEPVGDFYEDGPGNWWQIGPHDKVPHVTPLYRAAPAVPNGVIGFDPGSKDSTAIVHHVTPPGWKLVPVEPTMRMVIDGFVSDPEISGNSGDLEAYESMSGCEQAAHRARLCWAAMLAAAPEVNGS